MSLQCHCFHTCMTLHGVNLHTRKRVCQIHFPFLTREVRAVSWQHVTVFMVTDSITSHRVLTHLFRRTRHVFCERSVLQQDDDQERNLSIFHSFIVLFLCCVIVHKYSCTECVYWYKCTVTVIYGLKRLHNSECKPIYEASSGSWSIEFTYDV